MPAKTIEERLSEVEEQLARLIAKRPEDHDESVPWWRRIEGRFKDNPEFDEAMRLGRQYRESLRRSEDQATTV